MSRTTVGIAALITVVAAVVGTWLHLRDPGPPESIWVRVESGRTIYAREPGGTVIPDRNIKASSFAEYGLDEEIVSYREYDGPNRWLVRLGLEEAVYTVTSTVYHPPSEPTVRDDLGREWMPCRRMTDAEREQFRVRARAAR